MSVAVKAPLPADFAARAERLRRGYDAWLRDAERSLPAAEKLRRRLALLYRSKGERRQIAEYYRAELTVDLEPPAARAMAG